VLLVAGLDRLGVRPLEVVVLVVVLPAKMPSSSAGESTRPMLHLAPSTLFLSNVIASDRIGGT